MSYSSNFVLLLQKQDFHANTIVEQFKRLLQRRETFFPIETKLEYASSWRREETQLLYFRKKVQTLEVNQNHYGQLGKHDEVDNLCF